jgi:hypothetical protein
MTLETFAQASTEIISGPWAAAGAFAVLVATQMGKLLSDWRKDKRDAENDKAKRDALLSIAKTNQELLVKQTEMQATMVGQNTIQAERHTALVGALTTVCKKANHI